MKYVFALVTFASVSALACPDITGVYECEESGVLELSAQKNKDGVCILTATEDGEQGTLIADGKWHPLDEDMIYKATATNKNFKMRSVDSTEKNPDKARTYFEVDFQDAGKELIVNTLMVFWNPEDKKEEKFSQSERCQ